MFTFDEDETLQLKRSIDNIDRHVSKGWSLAQSIVDGNNAEDLNSEENAEIGEKISTTFDEITMTLQMIDVPEILDTSDVPQMIHDIWPWPPYGMSEAEEARIRAHFA